MKIAFLSSHDPQDKRSWSGIINQSFRALERHCGEVRGLGPFHPQRLINTGRAFSFLASRMLGKRYDYTHTFALAKASARFFGEKLKQEKSDLIFAPASSTALAFLETNLPIVYLADTTFARMLGYYPFYDNLLETSKKQGHEIERRALQKASLLLYPSQWAADSAVKDYGVDPARVHVFPLGANIESAPRAELVLQKKRTDVCHLLFLGVEWERKGGPVAFETLKELLGMGVDARMTVCGCVPPVQHEKLQVIPFLNKNDPQQRKEFDELLLRSDFLLLPTRAECFGVVFCEASAYGIPSISTNTGGVGGAVKDGVNGFKLPYEAGGKIYAEKIAELFSDEKKYLELSRSSREFYERELNWDAWGKKVNELIAEKILARK